MVHSFEEQGVVERKGERKLFAVGIPAFLTITGWAVKEPPAAEMQTFSEEIMDTLCGPYGSHEHMMQQMKSIGSDKKSCFKQCLLLGAQCALYDDAKHSYYRIDDQAKEKVEPFAGERARITGTLNKKTSKVTDIKVE